MLKALSRLSIALGVFCILAASARTPAYAAGGETGTLRGVVVNQDSGAPLPAVSVSAISPSGTFRTGAGLLNIAANQQQQFEALCKLIARPELATDPRFAGREDRKRQQPYRPASQQHKGAAREDRFRIFEQELKHELSLSLMRLVR